MSALWMLVAAVLFSITGACVKFAGRHYGVSEILFYRSLFGAACLFAFIRVRGMPLATPLARMHLARGVVGTVAVFFWFHATTVLPLGTALTLNYTSPLFLALIVMGYTVRSGGRVDWPLMIAVAIGFVGVILVLQPDFTPGQTTGAAGGLLSGVLSAIAYWQVKELSIRGEPEWRVVFYFSLTGVILGALGSLASGFTSHTPLGLLLLAVIGVATLLAQLAMTRAYGQGRTETAASLQFSAVVFAALLGVALFDDRIPLVGWAGIAVIIASGIASTALTARRRSLRAQPDPDARS